MARRLERHPASWAKPGSNARTNLGDKESARALALSRIENQVTPLVARPNGVLIDGHRTIWGLTDLGRLDAELDFIVTDEDLSPQEVALMQAVSAIHREGLPLIDEINLTFKLLETMSGKEVAAALGVDPATVSNWRSFDRLIPEAKQAVADGLIGVRAMVDIAKLPPCDQPALLAVKLGGLPQQTRAKQVERPEASAPPRNTKLRVPLPSGALITVTSDSLEDAVESLKEAIKAMNSAIAKGLEPSTAQKYWADVAKAR